MPQLDNKLWEAFARRLAEGMKQGAAMLRASHDIGAPMAEPVARQQGLRLRSRHEIQARVRELMAVQRVEVPKLMVRHILGRQWIIDELINTAVEAKKEKNYNASTKALELLGRELGMFATVIKASVKHDDPDQYSDAELIAIAFGSRASDPDPPPDPSKLN
jgi:hypothetical protein